MTKKIFFLAVFALIVSNLFAQTTSDFFSRIEKKSGSGGEVEINQSHNIFQAANEHIYHIKNKKGADRYRIWIFTGSRAEQLKKRAKFVNGFPNYTTYIIYEAPDFHIFVGDFYRRNEAKKALKEIKKVFPNAFDREFKNEIESDNNYIKHIK